MREIYVNTQENFHLHFGIIALLLKKFLLQKHLNAQLNIRCKSLEKTYIQVVLFEVQIQVHLLIILHLGQIELENGFLQIEDFYLHVKQNSNEISGL